MQTTNNDSQNEHFESETEKSYKNIGTWKFIQSHRIHDLQDIIFKVAPSNGQIPFGIFKDKFSEEMTFPTLFFGNPRDDDITKRPSYQKIVQWDVLHFSGYFSYHITNLFFKTTQIVIEKLLSSIWVRIQKSWLRGRKLLAKGVKHKPNLEQILKSDIRYIDFNQILFLFIT